MPGSTTGWRVRAQKPTRAVGAEVQAWFPPVGFALTSSPAGLTLGSIFFHKKRVHLFSKKMGCRVKPGNDEQSHPQTSSANSTIMRSFAHCSSSARIFPSSVEAKPHWGDRHN